jgi:4-carboxymuconolactone decarboxylase
MSVPRIPPREPPYPEPIAKMLEAWMAPVPDRDPLRIFRTFAIHEELAPRTGVLGAGILAHGLLAPSEREVVIQRTCYLCGAEYEWGVHAALFRNGNGLNDEQLASTVNGNARDRCWSERESIAFRLADELHLNAAVSDELFGLLREHYSDPEILELVITAGWYRTISYVIDTAGVEPEEWAPRFPRAAEASQSGARRKRG